MITFRSPKQPAHHAKVGAGFKFVGGRLRVTSVEADAVRAYALANPSLGIVEETARCAPNKPKPDAKARKAGPAGGAALQRGTDGGGAGS